MKRIRRSRDQRGYLKADAQLLFRISRQHDSSVSATGYPACPFLASPSPETPCRLTDTLQSVRCSRNWRLVNYFPIRKSKTDQGSGSSSYASEDRSDHEVSHWNSKIVSFTTTPSTIYDKRGYSASESPPSTSLGIVASMKKHAQNLRSRNAANISALYENKCLLISRAKPAIDAISGTKVHIKD